MTYPRKKPCPYCDSDESLDVFCYENGWRHVECTKCDYLGPGEGSILAAIRRHNTERDERADAFRKRQLKAVADRST